MSSRRRLSYSPTVVVVVLICIAMLVGSVLGLPHFLLWLEPHGEDWATPSSIEQSYDAVGAIFAGLAFLGVVLALVFQLRQAAVQQVVSLRQQHVEILKTVIANPDYERAMRGPGYDFPIYAYINLHLQNTFLFWRVGEIGDEVAHWDLADLFSSVIARDWWMGTARIAWVTGRTSRSERLFVQLVDKACQAAGERPAPDPAPQEADDDVGQDSVSVRPLRLTNPTAVFLALGAIGVAVGAVASWHLARPNKAD
ncbi:hypothetical protein FHR83_006365 [Actinoplanes campanulatus]|uniref:Uncharacterized protein n=1 Tax=Actinoplanes campanulatus TaxID=113559 RepID=A0A7W5FHJ9_9ACTN|nr:DUF6082 family protein [Actinoplanes campanulatus]MBB3098666.1 hypothetical protein [Actinoplanes campanulatus]GGN36394.1 hypothetical protein GCM10010109_61330 [Actinoplanes campanulatus]GID39356.1 hypothetical protein Aca09nite_58620 [Actinoplanes campanulatus]